MSIAYLPFHTPGGHTVMRASSDGAVTAADAAEMNAAFLPGGRYAGFCLLIITPSNLQLSGEARQLFADNRKVAVATTAIVVPTPSMRVMLNFIIKAGDALRPAGAPGAETRFFSNERDAVAWLDERLASAHAA
jgi:hypothetical protein